MFTILITSIITQFTGGTAPKKPPPKKRTYGFLPTENNALLKFYQDQRDSIWVPAEIELKDDIDDIPKIMKESPIVYELLVGLLAFFVPADDAINENLMSNFQEDTSVFFKEAGYFYTAQAFIETIHSETYSNFADVLITDKVDRDRIFGSVVVQNENSGTWFSRMYGYLIGKPSQIVSTYQSIGKLYRYMNKYMDRSRPLLIRIIAFACVEGIVFNTAFTIVYWIKQQGILRGFCKGNEFIARDEALHTKFAVALIHGLVKAGYFDMPTRQEILEVVDECVKINEDFNREILPKKTIGLSSADLSKYTKCTADALLNSFGLPKYYNSTNPFAWMAIISLPNKTNMFEDVVSEYSKTNEEMEFKIEDDY